MASSEMAWTVWFSFCILVNGLRFWLGREKSRERKAQLESLSDIGC